MDNTANLRLGDQPNNAYQNTLACEVSALSALAGAFLVDERRQSAAKEVSEIYLNAAQLLAVVKVSATFVDVVDFR